MVNDDPSFTIRHLPPDDCINQWVSSFQIQDCWGKASSQASKWTITSFADAKHMPRIFQLSNRKDESGDTGGLVVGGTDVGGLVTGGKVGGLDDTGGSVGGLDDVGGNVTGVLVGDDTGGKVGSATGGLVGVDTGGRVGGATGDNVGGATGGNVGDTTSVDTHLRESRYSRMEVEDLEETPSLALFILGSMRKSALGSFT